MTVDSGATESLIQHHVKYKELHKVDKIVMMAKSEHMKLHARLRKEGECNVPVDELHKISEKAHRRSPVGKLTAIKHESYRQAIRFEESFGKYTLFREKIRYNSKIGSVSYTASFQARQGHILPVINIGGNNS